ncbi:D-hexose-6-phosphate mutarotase [Alteromonas sp. AMM-1]|uniref:D-hexose-6-phosphate mutarotase n=1 Tax=Alteromonas sp. AMM-1 TaxID=3394233 RepID=UPI0039A60EF5
MQSQHFHTESKNGIEYLVINNDAASCRISLFGGHVLSYIPSRDNRDRLWVSPVAFLNGERPIRGGVPVCWPWFSDAHGKAKGELPAHGFLRTQHWTVKQSDSTATLSKVVLVPSSTKGKGFDFDASVELIIEVGESLVITLVTRNTGDQTFSFNCALHTYFDVENIKEVELKGLYGEYKDKLADWEISNTPSPYVIAGEVDRIHLEAIPTVSINRNGSEFIRVESQQHDSLVVWNPWQGAATMSDMDAFSYKQMVCVETAITQGKTLAPGEFCAMRQQVC